MTQGGNRTQKISAEISKEKKRRVPALKESSLRGGGRVLKGKEGGVGGKINAQGKKTGRGKRGKGSTLAIGVGRDLGEQKTSGGEKKGRKIKTKSKNSKAEAKRERRKLHHNSRSAPPLESAAEGGSGTFGKITPGRKSKRGEREERSSRGNERRRQSRVMGGTLRAKRGRNKQLKGGLTKGNPLSKEEDIERKKGTFLPKRAGGSFIVAIPPYFAQKKGAVINKKRVAEGKKCQKGGKVRRLRVREKNLELLAAEGDGGGRQRGEKDRKAGRGLEL